MPRLSVVILTWNEERNVAACLESLRRQEDPDFDVIVLDAASADGTVGIVRRIAQDFPVPLLLEVSPERTPIGAARNRGVTLAQAPIIAFLSADAEAHPGWTREIGRSLQEADFVFGRQVHAPTHWTTPAAVRGLRYQFPEGETPDPIRFASNVSAAYRREILEANPFEPGTNAAEDTLLAARAQAQGFRAAYNPLMVVHHHDVETWRQEWRKNAREGEACGRYADDIGVLWGFLGWGLAVAVAAGVAASRPRAGLAGLALALWLPALRRAWRRRKAMPARHIARGVAASPPFDLLFLVSYLKGLAARRERDGAGSEGRGASPSPSSSPGQSQSGSPSPPRPGPAARGGPVPVPQESSA